ncbi:MAG: FtsX-like permease family protein [Burkholderiaceae bacterium]
MSRHGARALSIKLLRDLWRLRAQALAIALVMAAGVGMVIMSVGMLRSLDATRAAYYEQYRFADLFAPVKRAPETLLPSLRRLPGVAHAESRISGGALLDVTGVAEPVSARVHSLPPAGPQALNQLVLRSGRLPSAERPDEAAVSEAFAKAARLLPGDRFLMLLNGKQMTVRLTGTVLSPEYVYAVGPGQLMPDNRRHGVLWMGREALAAALDLDQAFNEVLLRIAPGTQPAALVRELDRLLAPYGASGAYGRDRQMSDRFVSNEIEQLRTTVDILPPIFLGIAAFLLNIVLSRLIDTEREVIGLLKAFGYRGPAILLHYAQLALLLSAGGLLLGALLGSWLGRALAELYQRYFVFPFLRFTIDADVYLIAAGVALAAVVIGAGAAVRRAARLTPAEAMRPPAPPDFSRHRIAGLVRAVPDEPTRMIVRGLLRRPLRSALTISGLAAALALYIASASSTDNVDRMIELAFSEAERADLTVHFAEPRDARAWHAFQRMPGVLKVEPFRNAGARLLKGPRVEHEGLSGTVAGGQLSRLVDLDGKVIEPAPQGAIVSRRTAQRLGLQPGDMLTAELTEGRRQSLRIPVAAVVDSPLGTAARMERGHLNRLLNEGETVSGVHLKVDPVQLPELYRQLKLTPLVAGLSMRESAMRGIRDTIAESTGIMTLFTVGFAALIVLGVVYNSARISLSEQARDLASLRVLGFRKREVAFVLLGEQALLVLLSLPLGIAAGIALARYMTEQFSADLYSIPFGVNPATLAEGVLVVAAAAAITALLIRNRVDQLDLVRALKTRE